MKREEVYKAIDSEREFQDLIWDGTKSSRQPDVSKNSLNRSIDEFALYVLRYSNKLVEECTSSDFPEKKLDIFRKIAGLCVACGEAHGMPKRN
jgi:hypothetical protein